MSKDKKDIKKSRPDSYEPKLKFEGSFEDLINISVKDAEKKAKIIFRHKENPKFNVLEIEGGYQFVFPDREAQSGQASFTIGEESFNKTVNPYKDDDAMAIEIFKESLKED